MASHRPGPYDPQLPSLAEVQRAPALWTPGNWEVWEELATKAGRRVFQVAVAGKPVLYTMKVADANLAAAAPLLYKTLLSLLEFFEVSDNGDFLFVTNSAVKTPVPREHRATIPAALGALARARGRRWW